MLVLALQFSKGSDGASTRVGNRLERALRGQRERVLHAGAEVTRPNGSAPSKRKRRQSSSSRRVKRTDPAIDDSLATNPPMHQLGVVRTGQDECLPTIELFSLERR
jgi:hypothetical protein